MRVLNKVLDNKKIIHSRLLEFGFIIDNNIYYYRKDILNKRFTVIFELDKNKFTSKIWDNNVDDEYMMFDVKNAKGEFIGKIKAEYDLLLHDIISKCFINEIYKNKQTKYIIDYIKNKYNDDLEFLWEKYPDCSIVRNKSNSKWYCLFMKINRNKIDGTSNDLVDIIDLSYQKDNIQEILEKNGIYPGYHMNKKSWITIILDDSLDTNYILNLVDNSYNISLKK